MVPKSQVCQSMCKISFWKSINYWFFFSGSLSNNGVVARDEHVDGGDLDEHEEHGENEERTDGSFTR